MKALRLRGAITATDEIWAPNLRHLTIPAIDDYVNTEDLTDLCKTFSHHPLLKSLTIVYFGDASSQMTSSFISHCLTRVVEIKLITTGGCSAINKAVGLLSATQFINLKRLEAVHEKESLNQVNKARFEELQQLALSHGVDEIQVGNELPILASKFKKNEGKFVEINLSPKDEYEVKEWMSYLPDCSAFTMPPLLNLDNNPTLQQQLVSSLSSCISITFYHSSHIPVISGIAHQLHHLTVAIPNGHKPKNTLSLLLSLSFPNLVSLRLNLQESQHQPSLHRFARFIHSQVPNLKELDYHPYHPFKLKLEPINHIAISSIDEYKLGELMELNRENEQERLLLDSVEKLNIQHSLPSPEIVERIPSQLPNLHITFIEIRVLTNITDEWLSQLPNTPFTTITTLRLVLSKLGGTMSLCEQEINILSSLFPNIIFLWHNCFITSHSLLWSKFKHLKVIKKK